MDISFAVFERPVIKQPLGSIFGTSRDGKEDLQFSRVFFLMNETTKI